MEQRQREQGVKGLEKREEEGEGERADIRVLGKESKKGGRWKGADEEKSLLDPGTPSAPIGNSNLGFNVQPSDCRVCWEAPPGMEETEGLLPCPPQQTVYD